MPRDDAALVAALRREERAALVELYTRFTPLLARCAQAWGAASADRDELVTDVLSDVALTLMRHTTPVPRSLAAYLVTALRHRLGATGRAATRRAALERAEGDAPDDGEHDAVHALCSEHSRRAAAPTRPDTDGPRVALARLAAYLDGLLDDDERLLLAWLAHHVPLRVAAGWLELPYDTVAKRAQRLRARLRAAAERHLATLPPAERREVQRVLHRGAAAAPAPATAIPTKESER
ncbi:MAG TPA: hypothetical protein VF048_02000 [Gemmatimonadaceae bacterium]